MPSLRRRIATTAAFIAAMPVAALAQYNVHAWYSFEEAVMPPGLALGHNAGQSNTRLINYSQAPNANQLLSGIGRTELGARGLFFTPEPARNSNHLSIFSTTRLDRQRLGARGKALYQADFYLPPEGTAIPTTSLLAAVAEPNGALGYRFYRFGILEGGRDIFFSFTNGGAAPEIYHNERLSAMGLSRPGWHRFQIIFEGQDKIICAVNTKPTSFSPITERTHRYLNPGVWVSVAEDSRQGPSAVLMDNLSIQWTAEDVPLPESPWSRRGTTGQADSTETVGGSTVHWLTNTQQAWSIASTQQKPILTLFYAPNVDPYRYLESILPKDGSDQGIFDKYVLLKIDANQLAGGKLAQDWRIFRLPTFVIVEPNGNTDKRITVINRQTTWQEIAGQL